MGGKVGMAEEIERERRGDCEMLGKMNDGKPEGGEGAKVKVCVCGGVLIRGMETVERLREEERKENKCRDVKLTYS